MTDTDRPAPEWTQEDLDAETAEILRRLREVEKRVFEQREHLPTPTKEKKP